MIDFDKTKRYTGKVSYIDAAGWFFIETKEIPYTRIYAHWSALLPETIHFTEIKKGDPVEFNVIEAEDRKRQTSSLRAIKIDVLEKEQPVEEK